MKILGLDLSTTHIGTAIVDSNGQYLNAGELTLAGDFDARMRRAVHEIAILLASWQPDIVAIESPFVGKNRQTALQLGLMRGIAWTIAIRRLNIVPIEITPAEAKQALTGNGRASKTDMMYFARLHSAVYLPEHASDALGVAIAAWGQWREAQLRENAR